MHPEKDNIYGHLELDPDREYFLYIGEVKADCLNPFLRETLERVFDKTFGCISIVPDILASYPNANTLVVNPRSGQYALETGQRVSCRISGREFSRIVSGSGMVHELVRDLLQKQKRLFVHVYESLPELTLNRIPGVVLLGPDGETAHRWNNKAYQLERLRETEVPVIDFRICEGSAELLRVTGSLWSRWTGGMFISRPYSAAGMNSFIVCNPGELAEKNIDSDSRYLVSKYIPHVSDPTVLGVVAGPDDVFIAAVADQEIAAGNQFRGSTFPSALSPDIQNETKRYTRLVGRMLGQSGYRGIFGCDFIVDHSGRIHFVEVNARKQGTTMEMCCTLENVLPPDAPTLFDLEYHAVTEGRFPESKTEMTESSGAICWRTYNFKIDRPVRVENTLFQEQDERELFRRVAGNRVEHGMIVLEHLGEGLQAEPGSFLGRIVAVSRRRDLLEGDIQRGKALLEQTISVMGDTMS